MLQLGGWGSSGRVSPWTDSQMAARLCHSALSVIGARWAQEAEESSQTWVALEWSPEWAWDSSPVASPTQILCLSLVGRVSFAEAVNVGA